MTSVFFLSAVEFLTLSYTVYVIQWFAYGSGFRFFMHNGFRIRISSVKFLPVFRQSEVQVRILPSSRKNSKKNLYFYGLRLHYDCLSLQNDLNVPSKSSKHKN